MKKYFILVVIFISQVVFSQVSMSGNTLTKDGKNYKMSQYKEVFKNQEAQNYFAKARTNNIVGQVFVGVGGGVMGFGLARALTGGKVEVEINGQTQIIKQDKSAAWTAVGIGAGIVGIGIPFALAAKKNAEKAINLENGGSTAFKPYFRLDTTGTGLAISYNF